MASAPAARRPLLSAGRLLLSRSTAPSSARQVHRSFCLASHRQTRWTGQSATIYRHSQSRPSSSAAPTAQPDGTEAESAAGTGQRILLEPDNLFHPLSASPAPAMRRRAAFIRRNAFCPHPEHTQTRLPLSPVDPEAAKPRSGGAPPAHVAYECPDCGVPVACCEEHFADSYVQHLEVCDTLRQVNEDDHDLLSGRFFSEFEYPGPQLEEALINMTSWDTLLYTRDFNAINDERSLRQATKLLTYPLTVGSVLHELSPYDIRHHGLTSEGLKSFSALRYTLHPPRSGSGTTIKGLRPTAPAVRLFILGARAESSLPREVWIQLKHLFPRAAFHLIFIGPEAMANRESELPLPEKTASNPFGAVIEDRIAPGLRISTFAEYYHTLHDAGTFAPFDPYFDAFVMFHPGLGYPGTSSEWERTLPQLLETKVPIIATGYTQYDMQRDWEWVTKTCAGEVDMLLEPGENRFRSLRWDMNDLDPHDVSAANWGVWAFRGKRYETQTRE